MLALGGWYWIWLELKPSASLRSLCCFSHSLKSAVESGDYIAHGLWPVITGEVPIRLPGLPGPWHILPCEVSREQTSVTHQNGETISRDAEMFRNVHMIEVYTFTNTWLESSCNIINNTFEAESPVRRSNNCCRTVITKWIIQQV